MFHLQLASDRATRRRRWLATLFFLLGVLGIFFGAHRWTNPSPGSPWRSFGVALACIGLGVGVELGREWARWSSGILGLAAGAFSMLMTVMMIADVILTPHWDLILIIGIWVPLFPGLSIAVAVYCFLPSTRRHFAEVRQAQGRARAVPG